nr:GTP-binding protein [Jiangella aurantiaca]
MTGVFADAMAAATIALQWDLPNAVVVHHRIDVGNDRLLRTVSDVTGVLERVEMELEHACVSCAVREDVVPTLDRLARSRRWDTIVAHLPVGADAVQVCRVVAQDSRLRHVRIAGVLCAVDGARVGHDLLGDELLHERGVPTAEDDDRGVAEVAAAQVEYADAITVIDGAGEAELVRAHARPGAGLRREALGRQAAAGGARLVEGHGVADVVAEDAWDVAGERPGAGVGMQAVADTGRAVGAGGHAGSRLLVDGHVLGALSGERAAVPAGPAVAQPQSGDAGHQVQLGRPRVAGGGGPQFGGAVGGEVHRTRHRRGSRRPQPTQRATARTHHRPAQRPALRRSGLFMHGCSGLWVDVDVQVVGAIEGVRRVSLVDLEWSEPQPVLCGPIVDGSETVGDLFHRALVAVMDEPAGRYDNGGHACGDVVGIDGYQADRLAVGAAAELIAHLGEGPAGRRR